MHTVGRAGGSWRSQRLVTSGNTQKLSGLPGFFPHRVSDGLTVPRGTSRTRIPIPEEYDHTMLDQV